MAQTRSPRKPADHKPPARTGARKRAADKPKPDGDLKPLKAVVQLFGKRVDKDGETIGEGAVGQFVIYAPRFKDAHKLIVNAWDEAAGQVVALEAAKDAVPLV